jgi:hypothetical protein
LGDAPFGYVNVFTSHVNVGFFQGTALNLSGIDVAGLARGEVLADPGTLRATRILDAWLETLPDAPPIAHGA